MTREEALKKVRQMSLPKETMEIVEALAPELAESEDERIRRWLCDYFSSIDKAWIHKDITCIDILRWLEKQKDLDKMIMVSPEVWDNAITDAYENGKRDSEKQKENPKSADSISSNCVSDAKCENRWHKVTDSLPDNGRLVLAKDCLGNVLLARYDGENWEVNVYDNEDHYCHNSISKWCEIPSEKQKEQKPAEKQDYSGLNDLERAIHRGFLSAGVENVPITIIKETAKECIAQMKPAEWSEEDEKRLELVIDCVYEYYPDPVMKYKLKDWLKSLRPFWKPSEEQMKALSDACCVAFEEERDFHPLLSRLYHDLRKL